MRALINKRFRGVRVGETLFVHTFSDMAYRGRILRSVLLRKYIGSSENYRLVPVPLEFVDLVADEEVGKES